MINNFLGLAKTEFSSTANKNKTIDSEKGKLIMLVNDFYYGKHEGDVQEEQKTYTTFKCFSCLKVLKNNIRYVKTNFYLCLKIGMLRMQVSYFFVCAILDKRF